MEIIEMSDNKNNRTKFEVLEHWLHHKQCISCQGRGVVIIMSPNKVALQPNMSRTQEHCPVCHGTGIVNLQSMKINHINEKITPKNNILNLIKKNKKE
ncbi:zinc finger-like domain-containing protein [Candidatus Desantisbacteria bacterium]|nr:zinc finger-like domain-containing protein [Candidatus Desantisbacteria bacterium]